MAKSKRLRTLMTDGGVEYVFNTKELKRLYNGADGQKRPRGEKGRIVNKIAEITNFEIPTVKSWIRGDNGPSEIEAVRAMERFFGVPEGSLLTPRAKGNDEEMGHEMRDIPDYERDAARRVYRELCIMTAGLHYCDPTFSIAAGLPTTTMGFRYLGKRDLAFDYRELLQSKIRREGFDLPKSLRDALSMLVGEAFGDDCGETGLLYLNSEDYSAWLKDNNLLDDDDARETYSIMYTRKLEERIDELFADYMRN